MNEELRITSERDGLVLYIEIRRPEVNNRLTPQMMREIVEAVARLPDQTGCVLLAGAGGKFCLGADGVSSAEAVREGWSVTLEEFIQATRDLVEALMHCPVPYVAAIDGRASGIGVTCALVADARVVTPRARLLPNQLQAGLSLDAGVSYALLRTFGPVQGMGVLLNPEGMTGQEMVDRGVAVVPVLGEGDREAWLDAAARMASLEPFALHAARDLLTTVDFDELWQREVQLLRTNLESGRLLANLERRYGPGGSGI